MPRLVALDLPWGDRFVSSLVRIWEAGDAVCPLDPRLSGPAATDLLAALRPTHVLGSDGSTVALEDGIPVEPGDALVVATSGSGDSPKGVVLTHEAVSSSAFATSDRIGVDPDSDRWLACIPLSHVGGLGVVTRAVLTGTPVVVHERFDADAAQAAAHAREATLVSLVPAALRRMDASLFRTVLLGGAAAPEGLASNVVATYGLTETSGGVVYDGLPLEGVELAIRSDGPGEILVRGPMLLRAYRDGTDPKLASGWLATGDAGTLDHDGRLRVAGRIAETINTGGEKVWPGSVEPLIAALRGVAEVAVAGRPDPDWGERVVAFVVPHDRTELPSVDAIRDAVASRLAPWAAPKEVVFVDHLPRTASGKVLRRLLP